MGCHHCVNHFPQHRAACLEPTPSICYLRLLHSPVGAASSQLCQGGQGGSSSLSLSGGEREQLLLVKQGLQSAKPSIITLLGRGLAAKRIFTQLQDEQPLFSELYCFKSFCPLSSRGRNNINPDFQASSQEGCCRVPPHTSHCSRAAQTMQQQGEKQPLLFHCLCPEPSSYRSASSVGAGTCPVLQLEHHRASKAIRALGTACTGHTPSPACTSLPLPAHSGRLCWSHRAPALLGHPSPSLLTKLLSATRAFPYREERVFGHLQALLIEELQDQLEQILQEELPDSVMVLNILIINPMLIPPETSGYHLQRAQLLGLFTLHLFSQTNSCDRQAHFWGEEEVQ